MTSLSVYAIFKIVGVNSTRGEFIAKQIADLGKAVLAIGVASYFFKGFPVPVRIIITMVAVTLLVGSFFIFPTKGGN